MIWNKKKYALECLEAGVDRTYQAYVKQIKMGRTKHDLTPDEKERARSLAKARAVGLCKEVGINFSKYIPDDFLGMYITRIINARRFPALAKEKTNG